VILESVFFVGKTQKAKEINRQIRPTNHQVLGL